MPADRRHRALALQAQGQAAFPTHGVAGVDRHVDQRGLELALVGAHEAGRLRQLDDDADARAGDRVEHVGDAAQARADVEDLGLQRLAPGEGEELAGELGRAVHGVGDRVDVAAAALLGEVGPAQEFHGGPDDGQEVVEVVGHPAGELADGLQLLRLPQGLLGLPLLSDVAPEAVEQPVLRHDGPEHPAPVAGAGQTGEFDILDPALVAERPQRRLRGRPLRGGHEVEGGPAQGLGLRPAERPAPGRVRRLDPPVPVRDEQPEVAQVP